MIVGIIGTRKATNYDEFKKLVSPYRESITGIVSGGAKGIDTLAKRLAQEWDVTFEEFLPDYAFYGRRAPLIRNSEIVNASDKILAFPASDSRGTFDTISKARNEGKMLCVINADSLCG
ncbi:MAG: DNA-protecting protein DprA [Prevotella sp.]|nr:DNA-protecting protein DprA [Prevotella sp.]